MAVNKTEQLDYGILTKELKENGPQNLYLLYGPEDYLIADFVRRLKQSRVPSENEDFNVKILNAAAPAMDDVEDAINAMPFFCEGTFVQFNGFDINKCSDDRILRLLLDVPDWCTVAIILPNGSAPDGRLSTIKKIKSVAKFVNFTPQKETQLYTWISRRFQALGKRIDRPAMDRLMFISGSLMSRLIPEIEKIGSYAKGETVTVADVDAVAHHIPEAITFEMTDAIAANENNKAFRLLTELLEQNLEPIEILGGIGWQMRRLYGASLCRHSGKGTAFAKTVLGINSDYALRMLMESAKNFSLKALTDDLRLCAETDFRMKSSSGEDSNEILKEFLIRMMMVDKCA